MAQTRKMTRREFNEKLDFYTRNPTARGAKVFVQLAKIRLDAALLLKGKPRGKSSKKLIEHETEPDASDLYNLVRKIEKEAPKQPAAKQQGSTSIIGTKEKSETEMAKQISRDSATRFCPPSSVSLGLPLDTPRHLVTDF